MNLLLKNNITQHFIIGILKISKIDTGFGPKGLDPMVESEEFFTVGKGSILVRDLPGAMGTPWGSGRMCGCT